MGIWGGYSIAMLKSNRQVKMKKLFPYSCPGLIITIKMALLASIMHALSGCYYFTVTLILR